jgi:hypothetical protein
LALSLLLLTAGDAGAHEITKEGLKLASDTVDVTNTDNVSYASDTFTIKAVGYYTLSGTTTKAQVKVDTGVKAKITFAGVNMSGMYYPFVMAGADVTLTLAEGTENFLKSTFIGIHAPEGSTLVINGSGSLEVRGILNAAAIGGSTAENGGKITIEGGNVTALNEKSATDNNPGSAAGIGGGKASGATGGGGGEITITGGVVTATGGTGIGGGGGSNSSTKQNTGGKITITGGVVTATGNTGAGIGGGDAYNSDGSLGGSGGEITITGGVVKAVSSSGQGIGVGRQKNSGQLPFAGKITITGGYIDTTSINGRLPAEDNFIKIGGGTDGMEPVITVGSIAESAEITSGIIFIKSSENGTFYGSAATLTGGAAIPAGKTLTIENGKALTIPEGSTLTIEAGATLINNGTLTNNGKIVRLGTLSGIDPAGNGRVVYLPGVPTNVKATAKVDDSDGPLATVTFAAPEDCGNVANPDSLRYIVKCYMKNESEEFVIVPGKTVENAQSSPVTITGLGKEEFYVFTVTAVNEAGEGSESGKSNPPVSPGAQLPDYAASVNPTEKAFDNAVYGYETVEEEEFKITNTGTNPFTGVTACLEGGEESDFEIVTPLDDDVTLESELTMSVRPKTGLDAGEYEDTLKVTGAGGEAGMDLQVPLTFTVTKAGQPKPNPPEADTIANNMIKVYLQGASNVNAPNAQFAYKRASASEWEEWTDGTSEGENWCHAFDGLDESTKYDFRARFKETGNYSASAESETRSYTTKATIGAFAGGDTIYDGATGDGWMYAGGTFTVDSAYTGGSVSFTGNVTVTLDGDVTINNNESGPAISSEGTVTITAEEDTSYTLTLKSEEGAAIFAEGDITISGPVTVTATGETAGIRSENGNVTIEGAAKVTAAGTDTNSSGIDAFGGVTVDLKFPGELRATGSGTGYAIEAANIYFKSVPEGSVTLTNLDAEDDGTVTQGNINGDDADNVKYAQKNTPAFVAVTGVTDVPEGAVAGTDLPLTGTVEPDGATHTEIVWSVADAGTTGAQIVDVNSLRTNAAGTAVVTATIANGLAAGTPYTQNFNITVTDPSTFVPVTDITGVPATATAGTDLALSGTVSPSNATNKTIVWTVKSAGATGAAISGNTLKTTAAGTVTVTATITDGTAVGTAYAKNFEITVKAASPSYVATISPDSKIFPKAAVGYGDQTAQEFAVKNTGTAALKGITASLTGSGFEISKQLSSKDIDPAESATVSVRPKKGLASGTYSGSLVISGDNDLHLSAALSFAVSKDVSENAEGGDNLEEILTPISKIPDAISEKVQAEFDAAKEAFAEKGITLIAPDAVRTLNLSGSTLPESVKNLSQNAENFIEVKNGSLTVVTDVIKEEIAKVARLKNAVDTTKPIMTHDPVAVTLETRGETAIVPVPVEFGELSSAGADTFGDIVLMKVKRDGSLAAPSMKSGLDAISEDGDYIIKDGTGETVSASAALNGSRTYYVYIAITDDSAYDWNKTAREIFDPLTSGLRTSGTGGTTTGATGNKSGGGCGSGAFAASAVILLAAVTAAKKRNK